MRSDKEAVRRVAGMLGKELVALELVNPWFYHLDTCLCPISEVTVIYYPGAFTALGRRSILEHFPDPIAVAPQEAYRLVCNSVGVGRNVVMSRGCPAARSQLQERGYVVHEVDVGEFLKAGGGAKCLVLFLARSGVPMLANGTASR